MEVGNTENKVLNKILDPFTHHESNFHQTKEFLELKNKIEYQLKSLKISNVQYEADFAKSFFDLYNNMKNENKVTPIMYRQFMTELKILLSKIDDYKITNLINNIKSCEEQVNTLENTVNTAYLKKWFGNFCKNITTLITNLYKRSQEVTSKSAQNLLIMHIFQLTTSVQLILKLFIQEVGNKILIIESRRFVLKRFKYHFEEIKEVLKNNFEEDDDKSNFIYWMDQALDAVGLIERNHSLKRDVADVKPAIEEVLCHAMSTSQISNKDDTKAIRASVQSVLHEFNKLETECKNSSINSFVINLHVDLICDKLCLLERRINNAVLRISLKAFSDYLEPLKQLQKTCESADISILSRSEVDLDSLISDFDLHVDRVMHIGLFAIACSTDDKILAKIRSALSSLEALECELVPALTTLYMEPSQVACLHSSLFVEHWIKEMEKLKEAVFFIIDPLAFAQIVREEYGLKLETIQNIMSEENGIITEDKIENISKGIDVLIDIIKVSLPDLNVKDNKEFLKHLKNLEDVFHEVSIACKTLTKNPDRKSSEKILKRLLILQTMIERIMKILNADDIQNITYKKENTSIKSKIDVTHIIDKGQKLLKDRSMLFRTPKTINKNKVGVVKTPKKAFMTPKSAKYSENRKLGISFAKKVFTINYNEIELNNTLNLHITDILEELTGLSDTLG